MSSPSIAWMALALEHVRDAVLGFDDESLTVDYANATACALLGAAREQVIGRPIVSVFSDLDLNGVRRLVHAETAAVHTMSAMLKSTRSEVPVDLQCLAIEEGARVRMLLIAREHTSDKRLRRLEALWELITRRDLSLEEQGRAVLAEGIRGLDVDGAALSHRHGDNQVADYTVGVSQVHPGYRLPFREALAALAQAHGGYYACNDTADVNEALVMARTRHYAHRSFITQTFNAGDRQWSVTFSAYKPRVRPFDEDDRTYVGLLADYFARHVERRDRDERMSHLAYHDVLTGLPNRAQFLDRLDEALACARRDQRFCAVLFLDLDGFKDVNDSFGHQIGDRVLFDAAQRVRKVLRRNELLGRLGGDEFAILLPILDTYQNLEQLRERVAEALAAPFVIEGKEFVLSASVGAAVYPRDGEDRDALLARADEEMYRLKHGLRV